MNMSSSDHHAPKHLIQPSIQLLHLHSHLCKLSARKLGESCKRNEHLFHLQPSKSLVSGKLFVALQLGEQQLALRTISSKKA
jgi:hypothetical protein